MNPRSVLVTGANSEIGFEACRQSLECGDSVIALYHHQCERLHSLVDSYGEQIQVLKVDFSAHASVESFIEEHADMLAKVDKFLHLAALRRDISYGEITSADLLEHFTVNVLPSVLLSQYLGASMARKGWGRIVIGSSIGVKFGGGDSTYCYSLSKLSNELIPKAAKEWSMQNVLMNVIRIGVTDTEGLRKIGAERVASRESLVPMKRLASAKEMASSLLWFSSEKNTYISGQVIAVSGGE